MKEEPRTPNETLRRMIDEHIKTTLSWMSRKHPTLLTPTSLLVGLPNNTDHYLSFRFEPFTISEIRSTLDQLIQERCSQ